MLAHIMHIKRRLKIYNYACFFKTAMKNKIFLSIIISSLILFCAPSTIMAQLMYTFRFECITNNNANDCKIGERQLRLEVMDISQGVKFTFINLDKGNSQPSSITDVYFDDPTLTSGLASSLFDYSNVRIQPPTDEVAFSAHASPPDPGS